MCFGTSKNMVVFFFTVAIVFAVVSPCATRGVEGGRGEGREQNAEEDNNEFVYGGGKDIIYFSAVQDNNIISPASVDRYNTYSSGFVEDNNEVSSLTEETNNANSPVAEEENDIFSSTTDSSPLASSVLADNDERVMVCYHGSWAVYRPGRGRFMVEDIDPFLCTHLVYAFAGLKSDTLTVHSLDPYNDLYDNYGKGGYKRFTGLKNINPSLKTLLGLGGWNEGSEKYSQMVSTAGSRSVFIASCVKFLLKFGFDGLDIDWEYPAFRGGRPQDKVNFAQLLKEMRSEFDKHGLLMTAAVSAGKLTINKAYDVQAMARYLDLVNLMTYDFHGSWEKYAHHHEPLYAYSKDSGYTLTLNVDYAVRYWLHLGLPSNKLVMGVGLYGHCYTLTSAANHSVYAPAPQPGLPGPYTRSAGILGYNEICQVEDRGGWVVVRDKTMVSPYAYSGRQWCGYDDTTSAAVKAQYIKDHGLAGAMVWSLDTDDFQGDCARLESHGSSEERNEENNKVRKVQNIHPAEEEEYNEDRTQKSDGDGNEEVGPSGKFPVITTIRLILRDGKPIPTPYPPPVPIPTSTAEPNVTTTTEVPTTTVTPEPTPDPNHICHREGFNADPRGNCMVFYACHQEGGRWQVWMFHCAPGTVFVEDLQACDFPENHPACQLLPTLPPMSTQPPSTQQPYTRPTSTLPVTTPDGPIHDTSFLCHRNGLIADPGGSCTLFYGCHQERGNWHVREFECPPGEVFVENLQACDLSEYHPLCHLLPALSSLHTTVISPSSSPITMPPTTQLPSTMTPTTSNILSQDAAELQTEPVISEMESALSTNIKMSSNSIQPLPTKHMQSYPFSSPRFSPYASSSLP